MKNYKEDWLGDNTMEDVKDILGSILKPTYEGLTKDALLYDAGITEAAKRILRKTEYVNSDILRLSFNIELEGKDE